MPGNPTVTLNHSYVRERATRIRDAAKRTAEGSFRWIANRHLRERAAYTQTTSVDCASDARGGLEIPNQWSPSS
jgi:hypothetical protein